MNSKHKTSFEVYGITYTLVTENYKQITKSQLNKIREYDALQKANGKKRQEQTR